MDTIFQNRVHMRHSFSNLCYLTSCCLCTGLRMLVGIVARMVPTAGTTVKLERDVGPTCCDRLCSSFSPLCSHLTSFDQIRVGPILTVGFFLSPFLSLDLSSLPPSIYSQLVRHRCFGAPQPN